MEIKYLRDHGVHTVVQKDGTELRLETIDLSNLNWSNSRINMLKAGIYRSKTPTVTIEEHGGGKLEHHIFWYLCFYLPKWNVGLYGADSTDYVQPYLQNRIQLQGEIIELTENRIAFFIVNHETGINIS